MRNSEGQPQGGQRLNMARVDRMRGGGARTAPEPPVRTKDDPTVEETAKANAGVYAGETRTVEKVGGNKLLKAALGATGIVAGGAIAYEAVPAIHQAVDSAFLDHIKGKFLSSEASVTPDVFENKALSETISNENTVVLSREEIKRTIPPIIIDSVNNTSTILFPFQLPEGAKAQLAKTVVVPKDSSSGFSNQAEEVAITEILLSLGTKIVNPIEGAHVFLQRGNPKLREDPNLVKRASFYWYDEATDQLYTFSIMPTILPGPMFKPVIQGDEYYNWDYNWENLPVANRGLEIMETTQDFQAVVVDVGIHNGKMNSLDARMKSLSEKTSRRGEVNFFTVQGVNSGGKTKLVALENQN